MSCHTDDALIVASRGVHLSAIWGGVGLVWCLLLASGGAFVQKVGTTGAGLIYVVASVTFGEWRSERAAIRPKFRSI